MKTLQDELVSVVHTCVALMRVRFVHKGKTTAAHLRRVGVLTRAFQCSISLG